jgi:hypothetical protein
MPQRLKFKPSYGPAEQFAENSVRSTVRVVRRFSAAAKSFIVVIPSRLQPARDLLFRVFQQTLKPGPDTNLTSDDQKIDSSSLFNLLITISPADIA